MIDAQVLQGEAVRLIGGLGVDPQVMHEEACWLLENVGVRMNHPYLNKVLENTGYAGFDGSSGRMHILRPLVDWALEQAPKRSAHPVPSKYDRMPFPLGFPGSGRLRMFTRFLALLRVRLNRPFIFGAFGAWTPWYSNGYGEETRNDCAVDQPRLACSRPGAGADHHSHRRMQPGAVCIPQFG